MKTIADVTVAIPTLRQFIGRSQLSALGDACRGEERQWFKDRLCELADQLANMPETYAQDGMGDQAVAYLHYFNGSGDWYITEKDSDPVNDAGGHDGQIQAFGLADLGYGAELGYISIAELIENGVELDLHFTPCTLAELKETQQAA